MIVSASRRTDIPAFYSEWFMNRIRTGYCVVPNPFNPSQRSRVSLEPENVDVIVFWTRHAAPLLPHLDELDGRGYRYYFLYTLLDYPDVIDPAMPPIVKRLETFRALSSRVGPERVIWRYDPILLTAVTDVAFHVRTFSRLARELNGHTQRAIISFVDLYRKVQRRLAEPRQQGIEVVATDTEKLVELVPALVAAADENGLTLGTCAEEADLSSYGIRPGKCIDDELIRRVFGISVSPGKDPHQRPRCRCVASRDIGVYDTCLFGCRYCYATSGDSAARQNHAKHDPKAESMVA